jgi:predicted ATPase
MNRVIFTGAQGTGKTTLLNVCRDKEANIITEVVRNLSKEGIKINEMGDSDGQKKIFETYEQLLSDTKPYFSDRGLTDVLAYSIYLKDKGAVPEELVKEQFEKLKQFTQSHADVIYCYFPVEFDVVDDGVRSVDEDFRKAIDKNIRTILAVLGINYVTIRGSHEERVETLTKLERWLEYGIELYAESFMNNMEYNK